MTGAFKLFFALVVVLAVAGQAWSQEPAGTAKEGATQEAATQESTAQESTAKDSAVPEGTIQDKAQQTLDSARDTAGAVAESIDANKQAQEASAGILAPIYRLAEAFSFPAFHWIAFAVMVTGVVSFALQLTLGKLVVLARLGFSPSEILSDALGLVVSLVGLVLTTQAAAENSTFTKSAAAVLSAAAVGAIAGFVFYLWGQRQELQAVEGRRRAPAAKIEGKGK
jgi:ABC-type multidrug transport system fused ATPase/permease subunit